MVTFDDGGGAAAVAPARAAAAVGLFKNLRPPITLFWGDERSKIDAPLLRSFRVLVPL